MQTLSVNDLQPGDILLFEESPYFLLKLYKILTQSKYVNCCILHDMKNKKPRFIEIGGSSDYSEYSDLNYILKKYKKIDVARYPNILYNYNNRYSQYSSIIFAKDFSYSIFFNLFLNKIFNKFNKNHIYKKYINSGDNWTGPSLTAYILMFSSNVKISEYYEFIDSDYFINNKDWNIYRLTKENE